MVKLKKQNLIVIFALFVLLFLLLFIFGKKFIVCQHQRNVILELKQWQNEYTKIETLEDAYNSIGMWEYMNNYYWPGEGYYCSPKMSAKLEKQYSETIGAIILALEDFSGKDFGHDLQKWKNWIRTEQEEESK